MTTPHAAEFEQAERAAFAHHGLEPRVRRLDLAEPALRVRVIEAGEGPPLLLVPGDGAVAAAWAPLIAELPGRRVIVLDRPCFGLSDRFDYRRADLRAHATALLGSLLDAHGLERVSIAGSSGGAQWSLWFALSHPQRVAALAPMGAPAVCLPGFRPDAAARLLTLPGLGPLVASLPSPSERATGKMLSKSDARLPDHPHIVSVYHAARGLPGYGRAIAAVFQRSTRPGGRPRAANVLTDEELARIGAPTVFVWGEDEPYGTPDVARRAAALMPDARVEVVAGGWHHPWLADAAHVGDVVRDLP